MKKNVCVSSSDAVELLERQLNTWPLAATNFDALRRVQEKSFDLGGFTVKVQFNPSRIVSSAARTDAESLRRRKCFLCAASLPPEQERLSVGADYLLLCNPYPIFEQHFTLPCREHVAQSILSRFGDFLEMSRCMDAYVVFYNGPTCGASAPDHCHFQVATRSVMPMDDEITGRITEANLIRRDDGGALYLLDHYLRNGFIIEADTSKTALMLFHDVYQALEIKPGETEPKMNLFSYYQEGRWRVVIIPRRQHRPWQHEAGQLLSSPGAADVGGLFITPRQEDYDKMTPSLLQDVYQQVCLGNEEVRVIADKLALKR